MKGRRGIVICLKEDREVTFVVKDMKAFQLPHSALIPEEESHGR